MDLILGYLQQGVSWVVPFVILLGLLIFVHELGHFLVAKYYGVAVEVFSLGFGKKLLSFERDGTVYCLSLIPLGGYVKMYGDDPTADIPEEKKEKSFLHKPVGQRIAIVLAGPLMNLFFAGFLFFVIAMVGEAYVKPVIGDIRPASIAEQSGFLSGDQILSINAKEVETWDQVKTTVENAERKSLIFKVKGF